MMRSYVDTFSCASLDVRWVTTEHTEFHGRKNTENRRYAAYGKNGKTKEVGSFERISRTTYIQRHTRKSRNIRAKHPTSLVFPFFP